MEKFLDPRYLRNCGSQLGAVPLESIDRHCCVQSTVSTSLRGKLLYRLDMTYETMTKFSSVIAAKEMKGAYLLKCEGC